MAFGMQPTGFVLKRFEDIKAEIEAALRAKYGQGINLSQDSRLGKLVATVVEPLATIWEAVQDLYDSLDIDNAEGVALDNIAAMIGVTRLAATKTVVDITVVGANGTTLNAGLVLSVDQVGDRFTNTAQVTINQTIQQDVIGIGTAFAGAVYSATIQGVPVSYTAVTGDTPQSIAAAMAAALNAAAAEDYFAAASGTTVVISAALPAANFTLADVSGVKVDAIIAVDQAQKKFTVAGDVSPLYLNGDSFTIDSGANAGTYTVNGDSVFDGSSTVITVNETIPSGSASGNAVKDMGTTLTPGTAYAGLGQWYAEDAGAIEVPRLSLVNIENPQPGLDYAFNNAVGIVGRNTETDQELRARILQSQKISGSATIDAIRSRVLQVSGVSDAFVFENPDSVPDSSGRPPHSIEVVVSGGADADIAAAIFDTKAAGIETYGNTGPVTVTDSQGTTHQISFTRTIPVLIYLDYTITLDPEQGTFPSDGVDQVKAQAAALGSALFGIGQDVAPYKLLGITVPGIGEITLRLQRDVPPAPGDTGKIIIASNEVSSFDVSRVTVTVV